MNNEPTRMIELIEELVQEFRDSLVQDLANSFTEGCPVCESRHFRAEGVGIPCRDDEDKAASDFVLDVTWFVCMDCGAVYDTWELVVNENGDVRGKLEIIEAKDSDDSGFIDSVHEAVGYTKE